MQQHKTDIADFLADESFINYCKNSSADDVAFWENYISQNPAQREVIEIARRKFILLFNVLADADRDEQAKRLINRLNATAPVIKMDEGVENNARRRFLLLLKISGAAAIVLLATFFATQYFTTAKAGIAKTFNTAYGERKNIQLPDGSIVTLNAGSKLTIKNDFGVSTRNIYLEGEAFFDVHHNEKVPFIVSTPAMDIRALGTAFDVKAYKNETITETSLIRGLIEVTLKENNNQVLLLHPNQKIAWEHYAGNSINTTSPQSQSTESGVMKNLPKTLRINDHGDIKEIAWRENKLIFEDDSLNDIATLLERWYGARIVFKDEFLRNYRFTGSFEKEDLEKVLEFLRESRHFNFKIDAGETLTVILSK